VTAIDKAFASLNGQAFYGLPPNAACVTLRRDPLAVPERIAPGAEALVPFRASQTLHWRRAAPTHAPM
jgi:dihydroorotase